MKTTLFLIIITLLMQLGLSTSLSFTPLRKVKTRMNKLIVTTQWYLYGRKHFRKAGYYQHQKQYYKSPVQSEASIGRNENGSDGVDLNGRVIVITGANSGIGKEMTTYAAAKGAKVYMVCRSKERAEKARDEIISATKNENVKVVEADVSEFSSIRKAVKVLQAQESKIDCLVCNAGALLNDKRVTSEGNECTIASHLIGGSYLLSNLLLPQLKTTNDSISTSNTGRVIFITSGGMYLTKFPSWDIATSTSDTVKYNGVDAYSFAKRGQVLLAEENAKVHPNVEWVTAHPGWSLTNGLKEAFDDNTQKYLEPTRNTWEGAEGITWLMDTNKKVVNGELYLDRKVQVKHMAGPFFTEGSFTKNTDTEIKNMMEQLKTTCNDA